MTNLNGRPFDERVHVFAENNEPTRLEQLRAALVDSKGLDLIPEPEPLIGNMLYRDSLAWLYGPPGCCKSFIALDIAGCVGTGSMWQGFGPVKQGPVLYVVAEGVSGIKQRVRAWEKSMGTEMSNVAFLPVAVQANNAADWAALMELVAEMKPTMIVLDTQARVTTGLEENSAKEMGQFIYRIEQLRKAADGVCILVVHHTGRGGDHMRGSIAVDGAATTTIKVTKTDDIIDVECTKQKDAAPFDPFKLRLVPSGSSAILGLTDAPGLSNVDGPAATKLKTTWWDFFETAWQSAGTLMELSCTSKATFYRTVKALVDAGMAETKGNNPAMQYRLLRNPSLTVSQRSHGSRETDD